MSRSALAAALVAAAAIATGAPDARAGEDERCAAPRELYRLDSPLPRTAARIAARAPLTIVAIGSSSTAGAGASAPQFSYPSRLQAELDRLLPGVSVRVLNRGVNGERAPQMLARFERDVLAEGPDLVIWQVGANTVLQRSPMTGYPVLLGDGLARLRQAGADVAIMDMQYAPRILEIAEHADMERIIGTFGAANRVPVFHRFAVMRHWVRTWDPEFKGILSADGLHLNDLSYGCIARLLAEAIVDAARAGQGASR
jgi:lysophospholipase L1-like esterase